LPVDTSEQRERVIASGRATCGRCIPDCEPRQAMASRSLRDGRHQLEKSFQPLAMCGEAARFLPSASNGNVFLPVDTSDRRERVIASGRQSQPGSNARALATMPQRPVR
jgi:hypothetical protein